MTLSNALCLRAMGRDRGVYEDASIIGGAGGTWTCTMPAPQDIGAVELSFQHHVPPIAIERELFLQHHLPPLSSTHSSKTM